MRAGVNILIEINYKHSINGCLPIKIGGIRSICVQIDIFQGCLGEEVVQFRAVRLHINEQKR